MDPGETKLRAWREDAGFSLEEVSGLTGLSPSMLSRVERGQRSLRPRTKVLVARRLGVPVAELFVVEDPEPEVTAF